MIANLKTKNRTKKRLWNAVVALELMILGAQGMYLFLNGGLDGSLRHESQEDRLRRLLEEYESSGHSTDRALDVIRFLYHDGRIDEALTFLQKAGKKEGLSPAELRKLRSMRGILLLEKGDVEGALNALLEAQGIPGDSLTSKDLLRRLKKEGLRDLLRKTLEGSPDGFRKELDFGENPIVLNQKNPGSGASGKNDEVLQALLLEIEKNGKSLKRMMALASYYESRGEIDRALGTLKESLKLKNLKEDEKSLLHRRIGLLQLEKGDEQGAFQSLLEAAGIDPESTTAKELRKRFEKEGFERSLRSFLMGNLPDLAAAEKKKKEEEDRKREKTTGESRTGEPADPERGALSADSIPESQDADNSSSAEARKEGIELYRKQDYRAALEKFNEARRLAPDDPENHYLAGRALFALEKDDEALKAFQEAIQKNPGNARYHFHVGLIHFRNKRYRDASFSFETATKLDSNFYEAFYNLGVSQEKLGREKEAREAYRSAMDGDPKLWQSSLNLAILLKKEKKYDAALSALDGAIRHNPFQAELHYQKGEILSASGKVVDAVVALKRCVELDPDHFEGWFNLGLNLGRLKRNEEALGALTRASDLHPREVSPLYEMGRILRADGQDARAITMLEKVLTLSPGHRDASIELVPLYLRTGQNTRARAVLDQAVQKFPGDYTLQFNRGNLLRKLGDIPEALESYESCIHMDPKRKDAYLNLAELYRESSSFQKAVETYERLLKVTGEDPAAHREAGLIYYRNLQRPDLGKPHLERYLELSPKAEDRGQIQLILQAGG